MSTRQFTLWQAIPLSFFSKPLYRDVGHNWPGMGFLYLLLVTALATVPLMLKIFVIFSTIALDSPLDVNYVIDQIPEIHVDKGQVSVSVPQPYFIRMKETGDAIAVIDTTKPVSEWTKVPNHPPLVLGKSQVLFIDDHKSENKLNDLPDTLTRNFTASDAREFALKALSYAWVIPLVMAVFMIPALIVYRIIQALIYGLIGLGISNLMRAGGTYEACVRLACVAVTPAMALDIVDTLLLHLNLGILWYFLLAIGYLTYGIKASAQ